MTYLDEVTLQGIYMILNCSMLHAPSHVWKHNHHMISMNWFIKNTLKCHTDINALYIKHNKASIS